MDTKISCVRWKRIIRNRANIKSCFFSLSLANPFFFFLKQNQQHANWHKQLEVVMLMQKLSVYFLRANSAYL